MDNETQEQQNENMGGEMPETGNTPMSNEGPAGGFTPPEETPAPPPPAKSDASLGPVVGIIIIVILIILAGFYFWGSSLKNSAQLGPNDERCSYGIDERGNCLLEATGTNDGGAMEETTEVGAPLSGSDEVSALEQDLNNTDLGDLDAELESIDQELNF